MLDIGCGSGQFTAVLVASLKSFTSVTGVDVEEESLAEARQRFPGPEFRFLRASSQTLPFESESFDLICISKALHHVEEPEETLDEMWRLARTGGYLLINEMHRDHLKQAQVSHMQYHHLRSDIDRLLGINHHHTFTRDDLVRLVSRLDLRDRIIAEFEPDDSEAKNQGNIAEFIDKLDRFLRTVKGHPEEERFAERAAGLRERLYEHGISRCPQLVVLGRKE